MRIDVKVRPPGSFVVITDDMDAEIPEFDPRPNRIWWNEWCVAVGTKVDVDGETLIHFGDKSLIPTGELVFDGHIRSPSKCVTVSDADLVEYSSILICNILAHVRIWTNHPREPDEIFIEIT